MTRRLVNALDVVPITEGERKEFEAAISRLCPEWGFLSDGVGGYHQDRTDAAWIGWQAALASRPVPEPVAEVRSHDDYSALIRWLLNPLPDGTLLYEAAPPAAPAVPMRLYEELREIIDSGSDSMTHADALDTLRTWSAISLVGYKLVPIEPTPEMIRAAKDNGAEGTDKQVASDYRAMLAAAPEVIP